MVGSSGGWSTFFFAILLVIWLGALFVNLSHVADEYLAPVLLKLSSQLKCPPRLTAVTFLAWANEAPDMSANMAAIRQGRYQLALGSCVGAGMMIVCMLGGLLIRMGDGKLRVGGAMVRDITMYVIATCIMLIALDSGSLSKVYIIMCVVAYVCYILAVAIADFHHRGWLPHQRRRGNGPRPARRRIRLPGLLKRATGIDLSNKIRRSAKRWAKTRQRVARTFLVRIKRTLKTLGVTGGPPSPRKPAGTPQAELVMWSCSPIGAYRAGSPAPGPPFSSAVAVDIDDAKYAPKSTPGEGVILPPPRLDVALDMRPPGSAASAHPMDTDEVKITRSPGRKRTAPGCAALAAADEDLEGVDGGKLAFATNTVPPSDAQAFFAQIRLVFTAFACAWASVAAPLAALQRVSVPLPHQLQADPANPGQTLLSFASPAPCLSQFNAHLLVAACLSSQVVALHFRASMTLPIWLGLTGITMWLAIGASLAVNGIRRRMLEATVPDDADIQMTAVTHNPDAQMESIERRSGLGKAAVEDAPAADTTDFCIYSSPDEADRAFLGVQGTLSSEKQPAPPAPEPATQKPGKLVPHVAQAYEMSSADTKTLIAILTCVLLLAFAVAMLWIQLVATELVAALEVIGDISGIPHDILGMTVLVWGNCLGDLASSLALSRSSQLNVAMTAVYAGPLFDTLIAVPAGFALWMSAAGTSHIAVTLPTSVVIGCIMLICQGVATLFVAGVYGGRLPHWFGTMSWALYAVYIVVTVGWFAPDS